MVLSLFLGGTVMLAGCGEAKKKEKPAAPAAPAAADKTPAAPATDADKPADPADATKADDKAAGDGAAKQAPTEQATASYSPKMSDDGETQMVALKLPNMT
jgi:predicted lipid-binding transport protein (Tim44 family)